MARLFANILLFLSIYLTPWWLFIFLIIIFSFYFKKFYEGIIYGLLFDILYRVSANLDNFFGFKILIISSILIFIIEYSKKYLTFYQR